MRSTGKRKADAGASADHRNGLQTSPNPTPRAPGAQVARLRLTARCLSLSAVLVGDWPLHAELFDRHGRLVESWRWR